VPAATVAVHLHHVVVHELPCQLHRKVLEELPDVLPTAYAPFDDR